jgi:hypothetical protein
VTPLAGRNLPNERSIISSDEREGERGGEREREREREKE